MARSIFSTHTRVFTEWDELITGIDTIIMGRRTFEQAFAMDQWLYKDKRIRVLTRRPIDGAPDNVDAFSDPQALVEQIRHTATGDIWHMGGGHAIEAFERGGLVDRWEIYTVPSPRPRHTVVPPIRSHNLRLIRFNRLDRGVLEAWYEPGLTALTRKSERMSE